MADVSNKTIVALLAVALVVTVVGTVVSVLKLDGLSGIGASAITGADTATGQAQVELAGSVGITVTRSVLNLSRGYVADGKSVAYLDTNKTCVAGLGTACGFTDAEASMKTNRSAWNNSGWVNTSPVGMNIAEGAIVPTHMYIAIENTGTVFTNISFRAPNSTMTAQRFLCGASACNSETPKIQVKWRHNGSAVSCAGTLLTDGDVYSRFLQGSTANDTGADACTSLDYQSTLDRLLMFFNISVPSDAKGGWQLLDLQIEAVALSN